ncbi:uncharacterized protein LOC117315488 [Pecten maximus]|uniref:uncharacterized protein LOC117315488 n=1 Tax=Pecten maximus TaxID=6579 RepID=UPI0014591226|nr:uncharacterized protein LOC117315488 [Pecten maximus]
MSGLRSDVMNGSQEDEEMSLNTQDELNDESREGTNDIPSDISTQKSAEVTVKAQKPQRQNPSPYPCHVCRQCFERPLDFWTHLKTHVGLLQASDFLLCVVCGTRFKEEEEISKHLTTHSDDEISRCEVCSEPYNHFTRLHTGPKPFKCSLCLRTFRKSKEFHSHLNSHSGNDDYSCEICGKGFSRKDRLRIHRQQEHGIKLNECPICRKRYEESFEEHKMTHNKYMYVECDECHKVFSAIRSLAKHHEFHNKTNSFTCNPCGIKFNDVALMKDHVRKHLPKATHECNFCQLRFFTVDDLNSHMKTHTGTVSSRYSCTECWSDFPNERRLREHQQKAKHTSCRHFQCSFCPKRFLALKSLYRHEKVAHMHVRHTCKFCELTFAHPRNLTSHVTNIHPGKSLGHYCALCKITFSNATELDSHNKKQHSYATSGIVQTSSEIANSKETSSSVTSSVINNVKDGGSTPNLAKNNKTPNGSYTGRSVNEIQNVNTEDDETDGTGKELGEVGNEDKDTTVFVCRFCGRRFSIKHFWRLHSKRHKAVESVKRCEKCRKLFGSLEQFTNHRCVEISPYECEICDEPFASAYLLMKHRAIHRGPVHKCDKCNRLFTRKCNLERHMVKSHSWTSDYDCILCSKSFSCKQAHSFHLLSHIRTTNTCTVCNVAFRTPDEFDEHVEGNHKIGNMYKCQVCTDEFDSIMSYQVHQLTHDVSVAHKCKVCNMIFKNELQLRSHQKVHKSSSNIICNWCGLEFKNIMRLRKHQYRNRCWKGRSFQCIICGDNFQRLDLLQMHTKTHLKSNVLSAEPVRNDCVVRGSGNDEIGDVREKNPVDHLSANFDDDDDAPDSATTMSGMEECNSDISGGSLPRSEFLNADDVTVNEDIEGCDDPGQSHIGSVMFSCGVCNKEFSTHSELHLHINNHNVESHSMTSDQLSRCHDNEPLEINTNHPQSSASEHHNDSPGVCQKSPNQIVDDESGKSQGPVISDDDQMGRNKGIHDSDLYMCGLCEDIFQNIEMLNDHISKHANDRNSYRCGICSKVLSSILSFHTHCASHVASDGEPEPVNGGNKTGRVNVFDMAFLTLSNHSDSHTCPNEDETSTASQNADETILKQSLKDIPKQIKEERPGIFDILKFDNVEMKATNPLKCDICGQTFDSKHEKRRHKKQHTSEKETQVDEQSNCSKVETERTCYNSVSDATLETRNVVDSLMLYKCGICQLSFCVPSKLVDHIKVHLDTDVSALCSADSESPMVSVDHTGDDTNVEDPVVPSLSVSDNTTDSSGDMKHTCRTCKRVFPSADSLYSHCHDHVALPRIKIYRFRSFDEDFSGSVLVGNHPGMTKKGVYNEQFSRDVGYEVQGTDNQARRYQISDRSSIQSGDRFLSVGNSKNRMHKHIDPMLPAISRPSANKHTNSQITKLPSHSGTADASRDSNTSRCKPVSALKCKICSRMFGSAHGMDVHYQMAHNLETVKKRMSSQTRSSCTRCNRTFPSAHALHVHEGMVHSEYKTSYKCTTCGMGFLSKLKLQAHIEIHKDGEYDEATARKTPYKCVMCNRAFSSVHGIRLHAYHHTDVEDTSNHKYRCLLCKISFDTILQLRSHVTVVHNDYKHCNFMDDSTDRMNDSSSKKEKSSRDINASSRREEYLSKATDSNRELVSNGRTAERSSKSTLSSTSSSVRLKSSTVQPADTQYRPCQCLVCNRVYPSTFVLRQNCKHCHTVTKVLFPYKCLICQKKYSTIRGIRIHMLSHVDNDLKKSQKRRSDDTATSGIISRKNLKLSENSPNTATNGKQKLSNQCLMCGRIFNSGRGLRIHMQSHPKFNLSVRQVVFQSPHSTKQPVSMETKSPSPVYQNESISETMKSGTMRYRCRLCPRQFISTTIMLRHMKSHKNKFQCDMCCEVFSDAWSCETHRSSHKVNVTHACDLCLKIFPTLSSLVHHRKSHTGKSLPYRCDACNDEFKTIDELRLHCKRHINDDQGEDNEENPGTENNINDKEIPVINLNGGEHKKTKDEDSVDEHAYKCDICDKSFKSIEEIKDHCRSHTENESPELISRADVEAMKVSGSNIYRCNICDKEYSASFSLERHYRIHEGERMYICHICDKTFQQSSSLREHLLSHHQDALYKCNVCGLQYNCMKTLSTHKRTHTQYATESCLLCSKEFLNQQDFMNHKKECEIQRPYVCDICGKGCIRKGQLTEHRRIHQDTRIYSCFICDNRYTHAHNLKRHMEAAHGKNIPRASITNMMYAPYSNEVKVEQDFNREISLKGRDQPNVECSATGAQVPTATNRSVADDHNYKCTQCNEYFVSVSALQRHTVIHTRDSSNHTCNLCGKTTTTLKGIRRHMSIHNEKNHSVCRICGVIFQNKTLLRRHIHIHTRNKLKCDICEMTLDSTNMLKEHLLSHMILRCNICSDEFPSRNHLTKHLQTHSREEGGNTKTLSETSFGEKQNIQQDVDTTDATKSTQQHQCCVCGQTYKKSNELEKHLWNNHGERQVTCDICPDRFASQDGLKRHILQKHKSALHKCRECKATFTSLENLQSHIAEVHPQQPYACTTCNIQFQSMSEKHRHMTSVHGQNVNSPVRLIEPDTSMDTKQRFICRCKVCNKRFYSVVDRQLHMVQVHGTVNYRTTCSICGQMFSSNARRRKHEALHLGKLIPCPICQRAFKTKTAMANHRRCHSRETNTFSTRKQ